MELFEAINKRHSYRGPLKNSVIPRDDLRRMVQAGLEAPSGKNYQTTSFVIVDDEALVSQIRPLHPRNLAMQQAQAYICCIIPKEPEAGREDDDFRVEDCAAAVENIFLAATALGYATVWVDKWLRTFGHASTIGSLIGVPQDKVLRIILPLGLAAEPAQPPEKMPFAKRAWFNWFGKA